jgi:hypothetical protein
MKGLSAAEFICTHGHWHHGIFCNRCDVGMQNALLQAARQAEPEAKQVVLAMGTHDGADLEHTVNSSWYDAERTQIHGFEVGPIIAQARAKFRAHPEVQIHWAAVTDVGGGGVQIAGAGAHARVASSSGEMAGRRHSQAVPKVALHSFAPLHGISRVTYTLLDVESHEALIVQGMQLNYPENRAAFPVFQYENWNPFKGWSNWELARWLERCGYRLYAIGSRLSKGADAAPVPSYALDSKKVGAQGDEMPVLLRFNSSAYTDPSWCTFGGEVSTNYLESAFSDPKTKAFGSNTLAVAEDAIQASPWLREFIARHELR